MICVDSSVAIKWVLRETWSNHADALLNDATTTQRTIVAPTLLLFEVTNIIRQRVRRLGMQWDEADAILARFLSIPIELRRPLNLHARALRLTNQYDLPAAYDAHYVILAQELGCDLWTDDQRLMRELGDAFPFVRWIGDYSMPNPTR